MANDPFRDVFGSARGGGHASASDPGPRGDAELGHLLGLIEAKRVDEPLAALQILNAEAPLSEEIEERRKYLAYAIARLFATEAALDAINQAEDLTSALGVSKLSGRECELRVKAYTRPLLSPHFPLPPRSEFELHATIGIASIFAARGPGFLASVCDWESPDVEIEDPYQVWLKFLTELDTTLLADTKLLKERLRLRMLTCADAPGSLTAKMMKIMSTQNAKEETVRELGLDPKDTQKLYKLASLMEVGPLRKQAHG